MSRLRGRCESEGEEPREFVSGAEVWPWAELSLDGTGTRLVVREGSGEGSAWRGEGWIQESYCGHFGFRRGECRVFWSRSSRVWEVMHEGGKRRKRSRCVGEAYGTLGEALRAAGRTS